MYITIGSVFGGDSEHFDILGYFLKIWSFLIKQLTPGINNSYRTKQLWLNKEN